MFFYKNCGSSPSEPAESVRPDERLERPGATPTGPAQCIPLHPTTTRRVMPGLERFFFFFLHKLLATWDVGALLFPMESLVVQV